MANELGVDAARHTEWSAARETAFPDAKEVNLWRDYARGVQKATVMQTHLKWLRGLRLQFCKNVLKKVLTAVTDRIVFKGFVVPNDSVAAYLQGLCVFNAADLLFAQVIYTCWRDGNAGISLTFDNEKRRVILTRQRWWNGRDGLFIAYDDTGSPLWSLLEWQTPEGKRRTWSDGSETRRYIHKQGRWQWFTDKTYPKGGPIPTLRGDGAPLGLMVVHFARAVEPEDADSDLKQNGRDPSYGVSFFAGGLIGLQDALNDTLKMISAAARFTAFQILWASGVKPPDPNKKPKPIEPGEMLTAEEAAARFGAITAGSIAELLTAKNGWQEDIADAANVPVHTIKGNWPSGEALFRAEAPLIDQCKKGGLSIAPALASVAHKATVLENTYNGQAYNEGALITVAFFPPERYDPLTLTRLANERAEKISDEEWLRLVGYTQQQAKQILEERAAGASFQAPDLDDDLQTTDPDPNAPLDPQRVADLRELAADELRRGITPPATPEDDLPPDPADAGAQGDGAPAVGTNAETTLNGAQIDAALRVFDKLLGVGDGIRITSLVAVEMLVAVGIERTTAQAMVDDQIKQSAKALQTADAKAAQAATQNPQQPTTPPAAEGE